MTIDRSKLNPEFVKSNYIFSKVRRQENGCWIWSGRIDRSNRPLFHYPSHEIGKAITANARNYLYSETENIPQKYMLVPGCGSACCINPAHQMVAKIAEKQVGCKRPRRKPKNDHCQRGHSYTNANTRMAPDGSRVCRACQSIHSKAHALKRENAERHLADCLSQSANQKSSIGKYYVYHLIDPFTEEVFYIGKGCGARVLSHEKEAGCGLECNEAKEARILNILSQGAHVAFKIIKRNMSESAALWLERIEIEKFGFFQLTNKKTGTIPLLY